MVHPDFQLICDFVVHNLVFVELCCRLTCFHLSRSQRNALVPGSSANAAPKEPVFTCPVCMNKMEQPSATICGHIFCDKCIRASIQAQSKCPTCRRTLSLSGFHRVYLPTMDWTDHAILGAVDGASAPRLSLAAISGVLIVIWIILHRVIDRDTF